MQEKLCGLHTWNHGQVVEAVLRTESVPLIGKLCKRVPEALLQERGRPKLAARQDEYFPDADLDCARHGFDGATSPGAPSLFGFVGRRRDLHGTINLHGAHEGESSGGENPPCIHTHRTERRRGSARRQTRTNPHTPRVHTGRMLPWSSLFNQHVTNKISS